MGNRLSFSLPRDVRPRHSALRGRRRGWQFGQKYVGRPIRPGIFVFSIGRPQVRQGSLSRPYAKFWARNPPSSPRTVRGTETGTGDGNRDAIRGRKPGRD